MCVNLQFLEIGALVYFRKLAPLAVRMLSILSHVPALLRLSEISGALRARLQIYFFVGKKDADECDLYTHAIDVELCHQRADPILSYDYLEV